MADEQGKPKWSKQATEKVMHALNRADEIGGEIRDFLVPFDPTPARAGTWGAFKALYR